MICQPCKDQDHLVCPSLKQDIPWLNENRENRIRLDMEAINRSSRCACQHKVKAGELL